VNPIFPIKYRLNSKLTSWGYLITFLFFVSDSPFANSTFYIIMINNKVFIFYKNMHKINVLAFGSKNFNTSLEEIKDYLSFKLITSNNNFDNIKFSNYDILFVHEEGLKEISVKSNLLKESNKITILAYSTNNSIAQNNFFDNKMSLPVNINDLNHIVENLFVKKNFNKNSSIKIKDYFLDKNEKKLLKNNHHVFLTEKEIQLLELFLNHSTPINKDKILEEVWKYASDADTHTVETHIYRLRKKIKAKFFDETFIINNKNGYTL